MSVIFYLAWLLAGCSEPTAILLHIDGAGSEPELLEPIDVDALELFVRPAGKPDFLTKRFTLSGEPRPLSETLTLLPGSGAGGKITIQVSGLHQGIQIAAGEREAEFSSGQVVEVAVSMEWLPEACLDGDGDGYGRGPGCAGEDCDDTRAGVHPGAREECNLLDDDCDGETDGLEVGCAAALVCLDGKCVDRCLATDCSLPPGEPTCYRLPAPCQNGMCQYDDSLVVGEGCNDQDDCTSQDTCREGGICAGEPLRCEDPPAPICKDAATLVVGASPGICSGGRCSYAMVEIPCPDGCADGKCMGDPCWGVNCTSPPPAECIGSNFLRVYGAVGSCANGICSYPFDDRLCQYGCRDGQCQDCTPAWVDVTTCSCTPTTCTGCRGSKQQSDGCGNSRTVDCELPPTGCAGACCNTICCPTGWLCENSVCVTYSQVRYSSVTTVWERQDSYSGSRQVWDPSLMDYTHIDHNEVYQLDSAPHRIFTDRPEIWFMNYRCLHTNSLDDLGWHRNYQQNQQDWQYGEQYPSWCQRVDFNPWFQPADYYTAANRWWTAATGATWYSAQIWKNGRPAYFVLIRFTENKTIRGADGVLRRATPPLDYWGYANWKMDGTPTDPAGEETNSVTDGYYQGFITISLLPINQANNWGANSLAYDYGPIVWPRRGYRQWRSDLGFPPGHGAAWQQTSTGCRHPQAFLWGNYLYVFYLSDPGVRPDGSRDGLEAGGIFIARTSIEGDMIPGTWMCGENFAVPCLPQGYSQVTRDEWESSLSLPGPAVSPIISHVHLPGITSFSVAALAGTEPQLFVGVAESFSGTSGEIKLFISNDLVHWVFHSTALVYDGWRQPGALHYPKPINATNGDTTVVDARNFYLVGGAAAPGCQSWNCQVNRISVSDFRVTWQGLQ